MARPPVVTRHVTHTRCIVKCLHIPTKTLYGRYVDLSGIVTVYAKQKEKCRKIVENADNRVIDIESYQVLETFAMQTDTDFIKKATKILSQQVLFDSANKSAREENKNDKR